MSFFDDKQEVIEIELTQYGKELLSKGKFKPASYAFFDDDVLYDGRFGGVTETQNDVQDRILTETPRVKTQYVFSSREDAVHAAVEAVRTGAAKVTPELFQQTPDKNYALTSPLGTSDIFSEYAPSWRVKALQGRISSFAGYKEGAFPTQKTPLLNMENVTYTTNFVERTDLSGMGIQADPNVGVMDTPYDTKHSIKITGKSLVLQLEELSASFDRENFDIEMFIVEEEDSGGRFSSPGTASPTKREVLTPLKFKKKPQFISDDGLLLDDPIEYDDVELDPSFVEYYFDLSVDGAIDNEIICDLPEDKEKKDEYYNNQDAPECSDERNINVVYNQESEEEC
jgi:hypothetical protein